MQHETGGALFLTPPEQPPGVQPPPYAINFVGARTEPADAAGNRWIVWQFSDGTITTQMRIPWQMALPMIQSMGQATAAQIQEIQRLAGPQLLRPGTAGFQQMEQMIRGNGKGPRRHG